MINVRSQRIAASAGSVDVGPKVDPAAGTERRISAPRALTAEVDAGSAKKSAAKQRPRAAPDPTWSGAALGLTDSDICPTAVPSIQEDSTGATATRLLEKEGDSGCQPDG